MRLPLLVLVLSLSACASGDPGSRDASRPRPTTDGALPLIPCSADSDCPTGLECVRGFPFDRCRVVNVQLDASVPDDARNGFDACSMPPAGSWRGTSDTCTNFDAVTLAAEASACDTYVRAVVRCIPTGDSTSVAIVPADGAARFFWCGNEYTCTLETSPSSARLWCVSGGAPCEMLFAPD